MRRTKLVPHHMLGGGETEAWLPYCTGLKCVDDFGPSLKARALGLPVVGRVNDAGKLFGQGFDMNRHAIREGRDPAEWARLYVSLVLLPAMLANPGIDLWAGPNEQNHIWSEDIETPGRPHYHSEGAALLQADREEVMRWYAEFLWHFSRELAWRGKRAVIGGWAVGHPLKQHNLWPHYRRALQACVDWRAILERHEYGELNGDHSLRYRYDNAIFAALGFPALPVIISEWGGDAVPGSGPHRHFYKTAERFWDVLGRPMELAVEEDDYVVMVCVFTSGQGGGSAWPGFDITGWGLTPLVVDFASGRDPLPPIGDDEMANLSDEEVKAIDDSSAIIEAEAGKIRAIVARHQPAPKWWELWPEGAYPLPGRALAIPNKLITFYRVDGVAFNPQPINRPVNWTMWAVERRGSLLNVFDQAGAANDWWVRAEDVAPA